MDGDDTTTPRRGRTIATAVLWAVVVPVALGIGLAEGRLRLSEHPADAVAFVAPSTTSPAAAPSSTTSTFAPGTVPPVTTSTTTPAISSGALAREVVWYELADCESGAWSGGKPIAGSARWDIVARGYQGGLQFHPVTWARFRSPADAAAANLASSTQQIAVAEKVLSREGVGAWPTCGPRVGLARLLAPGHTPVTSADFLPAAEPTVLDDE